MREKGTYFVLRELHKWEGDRGVRAACEKLIQVSRESSGPLDPSLMKREQGV